MVPHCCSSPSWFFLRKLRLFLLDFSVEKENEGCAGVGTEPWGSVVGIRLAVLSVKKRHVPATLRVFLQEAEALSPAGP